MASPFPICIVSERKLVDWKGGQPRTLVETAGMLGKLSLERDGVDDVMKNRSLIAIPSILAGFPTLGVPPNATTSLDL